MIIETEHLVEQAGVNFRLVRPAACAGAYKWFEQKLRQHERLMEVFCSIVSHYILYELKHPLSCSLAQMPKIRTRPVCPRRRHTNRGTFEANTPDVTEYAILL